MRILLLSETLCAGGAELFVVRLANALAKGGHDVIIGVMNGEMVHPGVAGRIDPTVAVERAFQPAKRSLHRADRMLRALRIDLPLIHRMQRRWLDAIVRRWKPDVVHSHLVKADWLAAVVKRRIGGFRHVLTVHGEQIAYTERSASPQMLKYERRLQETLGQADGIAVISDEQERHFGELYQVAGTAITRIYNGYEKPASDAGWPSRARLGLPDDKIIFGMVSRGIPEKGWGEAIAAFERIRRDDSVLVLLGEGPFFDQLDKLPDGVILPGFTANPIEWIRNFDIGLLPSRYVGESLPTVIVEYLMCGVPVIASDIGEISKMMRTSDGELAGVMIAGSYPCPIIGELADAMELLADDGVLRQRLATRAIAASQKFDMAVCIEQYERLYRPDHRVPHSRESVD